MMRTRTVFLLLWLLTAATATAQRDCRQRLDSLFHDAERSYLNDDYKRLLADIEAFEDVYPSCGTLRGDDADFFLARYYKMVGDYNYGIIDDNSIAASYAERDFLKGIGLCRKLFDKTNEMVLHEELAQLYYKIGDYHSAYNHIDTIYSYRKDFLPDDCFRPLSQMAICNARLGRFDVAVRQIDSVLTYYKKHRDPDYYEALRKRAKILMLQADSLGSTRYKDAVKSYRQYVDERFRTIVADLDGMDESQRAQYWLATHQFLYDCFRLGNHAPDMLYDVALHSKGFLLAYERDRRTPQTTWQEVRRQLKAHDCAIEFVQYFGRGDEKRLGCLVLRRDSKKPQFIDLFATDSLLQLPLTRELNVGTAIVSSSGNFKDTLYRDQRLPQLVWSPQLMRAIGDADRVYFAPDGLLHQWAIEYIIPDTTKQCYRLSSTRNLVKKRTPPTLQSALLCGGISYDTNLHPYTHDNDVAAYRYLSPITKSIKPLPGTRKEVEAILECRQQPMDTLLVGNAATDEAFLRLLRQGYDVVHISTHGFFGGRIGIYNDLRPLLNDASMSKSGLLLAGSEMSLNDKSFDETLFDGVLSATELAAQDYSGVSLLVLSACQTGQGRVTADGVYGVQRALKQGGAQTMMLSLWNVNDYSTSLLMRFFYEELQQQKVKDLHDAFMKARRQLSNEVKTNIVLDPATFTLIEQEEHLDAPRYTNPFILIDAF